MHMLEWSSIQIFDLRMNFDMKPTKIHQFLQNEMGIEPEEMFSIRQPRYWKKHQNYPNTLVWQLEEWCAEMSSVPTNFDEAFMIGHTQDVGEKSFTFVMSALRLLDHAKNRSVVVEPTSSCGRTSPLLSLERSTDDRSFKCCASDVCNHQWANKGLRFCIQHFESSCACSLWDRNATQIVD